MNRRALLTIGATAALALALAGCSGPSTTPDPASAASAANPLVGEWTMTELEQSTDGEFESVPYSGQVIFTEAGTMAVQAMNPATSAPDIPLTVNGYEAYFGPITLNEDAGTFTVQIESAAVRDNIGQSFDRNYEVTGDTLVLTPADPAEGWRVTYERATD